MPRKVSSSLNLPLAIFSGVLYGLSFPPFRLPFLAWIALVPLLLSIQKPDTEKLAAFVRGFLALFVANLIIFSWLWPTFHRAGINAITTLGCWMALSAILSLYAGAFSVFYVTAPTWVRPFFAAAAWTLLDEVRSVALTGFPWALLSHTQARVPPVIQIASITGAAGVTFLIVLTNAAISQALASNGSARKTSIRVTAATAAIVLGCIVWGKAKLMSRKQNERTMTVAVLQGNIDQYRKWDDAYEADIRNAYAHLATEVSTKNRPNLIVWPETAVPGWVPQEAFYAKWTSELARKTGTPHLFGSLSMTKKGEHNAAILMTASGTIVGQYNKRHLVPFGEYVPFGGFLKGVVPYLGQVGTFQAGSRPVVFDVGGVRFAPNICYEAVFPTLVRESALDSDVIVNITNDGWFPTRGAPEQHFVTNLLRAVENGRPVVRAANTGISAFIDARGRVMVESGLNAAGVYAARIDVPEIPTRTFFSRWGNWFGWLCGLTTLVAGVFIAATRPRHG